MGGSKPHKGVSLQTPQAHLWTCMDARVHGGDAGLLL